MAPLHPREGSSLQDFINAVDLEQRGPDGWREVTLPREQYEAMLYQILVVDGGRTSSIVRKGCRRVNRKLDAQNHALVRGPTSSRSGGRGHVDVLSTAALHPGLRWRDLQYFSNKARRLQDWLETIPAGVDLADADKDLVEEVAQLPERFDGHPGLSILSKVLHAKRPRLIPILDRTLTDWYRPISSRRGESAWQDCVRLLHGDLAAPSNRTILRAIRSEIGVDLGAVVPSELRIADTAIWMQVRGFRSE